MIKKGKKQCKGRKLGIEIILAAVCLTTASCTAQTSNTTSGEKTQVQEGAANTEPSDISGQAASVAIPAGGTHRETVNSEEKTSTFEEIRKLLNEQGFQAGYQMDLEQSADRQYLVKRRGICRSMGMLVLRVSRRYC